MYAYEVQMVLKTVKHRASRNMELKQQRAMMMLQATAEAYLYAYVQYSMPAAIQACQQLVKYVSS